MASTARSDQLTALGTARPGGPGALAGRSVSRVGYGAMQLPRLDRDAAISLLRQAADLGVDHVDTAHFYGNGFANEVIAAALRPEDDVLVVSKVGAEPATGGRIPLRLAQRPEQLEPASRTTSGASSSTGFPSSTCAAPTTARACAPRATRSSTSTTSSP